MESNFGVMMLRRCETVGVLRSLKEQGSALQCEVAFPGGCAEASSLVQAQWQGVVFAVIEDRDTLSEVMTLLSGNQTAIRARQIRVIVFNKIRNEKLASLLMRKGCVEVLQQEPNLKALLHKTRQNLKITRRPRKDVVASSDVQMQGTQNPLREDPDFIVAMTTPLESAADIWLLWRKSDARKIMGQWMIDLVGPGPAEGQWEQHPGSAWKWQARNPSSTLVVAGASWIFSGRRPEFDWKTNRWNFISEAPSLQLFSEGGGPSQFRFRLKDTDTLEIANNSKIALGLLSRIQESFRSEYTIRSEGSKNSKTGDLARSENSSPSAWNMADLSDGDADVDWNDHGAVGRTQGANTGEFDSAGEVFKPMRATLQINGNPTDLIDRSSTAIKVCLPEALALPGCSLKLELSTEGYGNSTCISLDSAVEAVCEKMDNGEYVCSVSLSKAAASLIEKLWAAIDSRQTDIFNFLKAARGF